MTRIKIAESGFGCRIEELDLSRPLSDADFQLVLRCFGEHGVLCFPGQHLTPAQHAAFAGRFGSLEVNVAAGRFVVADHPEVMILSNECIDGQAVGLSDAGQGWHTDMSYSSTVAFLNVLYARCVPRRDGAALGATQFADMCAACDALPSHLRRALTGRTATHDFDKFWEMMRARPGSTRGPLSAEQRARKPPVSHPVILEHPLSGRSILYCNVGYVTGIDGLPRDESDEILQQVFAHQLRPEFQHVHTWNECDLLAWDNLWTLHNAVADYGPGEIRTMHRCQIMADCVFEGRWA